MITLHYLSCPHSSTGITVYSPMIKFGLNPSMKFGVVGIGGLGHMAVKFGKVSDSLYEEEEEEEECIHDVCR